VRFALFRFSLKAKSRKADGNEQLPADTQPKNKTPDIKKPDATAGLLRADKPKQYISAGQNRSFNSNNPASPSVISTVKNSQNHHKNNPKPLFLLLI
jgi:hypothetical protein